MNEHKEEFIGIYFPSELFDEEALKNTPNRICRMMEEFKFWRDWNELEHGKGIFPALTDDLVVVKNIKFTSFCQHHMMQFSGIASIAYLPSTHIVGLSKIARTVRKFASRPQLQENMTSQIADYLTKYIPGIKGIMVIIEAEHTCMSVRGARMNGSTHTSAVRGLFKENNDLKSETLELLK